MNLLEKEMVDKLIDLKDRENTNTLVYVIGYVMGCIIVFTGYQLNIF